MKFTEYDNISNTKIDKTKSWINPKYKQVFSAEIHYPAYYQIVTKYDPHTDRHLYFVAFTSIKDEDVKRCRVDELGRTRFSIASIWDKFCPDIIKDTQITLEYVESIGNCDMFSIEL